MGQKSDLPGSQTPKHNRRHYAIASFEYQRVFLIVGHHLQRERNIHTFFWMSNKFSALETVPEIARYRGLCRNRYGFCHNSYR
jgi:hypothetical protein